MWFILIGLFIIWKFRNFFYNLPSFFKYKIKDIKNFKSNMKQFNQYGLRMFCGRQGSGKTIGMVYLLEMWRKRYPKLQIYTNIDYSNQTGKLTGWEDLLSKRNGTDGIVFAIDEIQNEFSSSSWKDFPDSILSEITQQRKQRICILATSQVFTRVAKQLREQCYEVIECKTFFGRWTRLKSYDAEDYNSIIDSNDPSKKFKLPKVWTDNFIQTDYIRGIYDTFAKVESMLKLGFKEKEKN